MSDMLARIRAVKQSHEARWLALKGVVAVGIGLLGDGGTGIVVSIETDGERERLEREIPAEIQGVPVELRVTGPVRTQTP